MITKNHCNEYEIQIKPLNTTRGFAWKGKINTTKISVSDLS